MTFDENITLFLQIVSCILCKQLCSILEKMRSEVQYFHEKAICSAVSSLVNLDDDISVNTYEDLENLLEKARKKIWFSKNEVSPRIYCDYLSILDTFCRELQIESQFKNGCVCILFDEYENLNVYQQKAINSLIKSAKYYLTYKVAMRPNGMKTRLTLSENEQLKSVDDFEEIDYVEDIIGKDEHFRNFIKKTCYNRLKFYYGKEGIKHTEEDLNIENCLESFSDEEEIYGIEGIESYNISIMAKIIAASNGEITDSNLKVFQNDPIKLRLLLMLCEKLGKNFSQISDEFYHEGKKYLNWSHNYKKNVVYLVLDECNNNKQYYGFRTILKLSHYVIRLILEILHHMFELHLCDLEELEHKPIRNISIKNQDVAIRRVSELEYRQIYFIPVNGKEILKMTDSLGRLFRSFLTDKNAKKFEVNHFSIRATNLESSDRDFLDSAIQNACIWGVLISARSTKNKQWSDLKYNDIDYILHPIFAPYFNISYRKKQSCSIEDIDILNMLKTGNIRGSLPRLREILINELSGETVETEQLQLF